MSPQCAISTRQLGVVVSTTGLFPVYEVTSNLHSCSNCYQCKWLLLRCLLKVWNICGPPQCSKNLSNDTNKLIRLSRKSYARNPDVQFNLIAVGNECCPEGGAVRLFRKCYSRPNEEHSRIRCLWAQSFNEGEFQSLHTKYGCHFCTAKYQFHMLEPLSVNSHSIPL